MCPGCLSYYVWQSRHGVEQVTAGPLLICPNASERDILVVLGDGMVQLSRAMFRCPGEVNHFIRNSRTICHSLRAHARLSISAPLPRIKGFSTWCAEEQLCHCLQGQH